MIISNIYSMTESINSIAERMQSETELIKNIQDKILNTLSLSDEMEKAFHSMNKVVNSSNNASEDLYKKIEQ